MANDYLSDKILTGADQELLFSYVEFEYCTFKGFELLSADLSNKKFIDCSFIDCNLSTAVLNGALLRDVSFKACKMMGLQFDTCNQFGLSFSFEDCVLQHSSFYKTKIKNTVFRNCQLVEADFSEADMTASIIDNCDLNGAIFDQTLLEKADLRTAYNYQIDPEKNRIKKATFSREGLEGLLLKYQIIIN